MDHQAIPREFVEDVQHSEGFAVAGALSDKIITPDVVGMSCPQPYTRAVSKPQSASSGLFLWYFQAFLPPDTSHTFVVDVPTFRPRCPRDLTVAIATVVTCQRRDPGPQPILLLYIKKGSPYVWIGYSLGGVQISKSTGIRWSQKRDGTPTIPLEAKEFQRQVEARVLTGDWDSIRPRTHKRLTLKEVLAFYIDIKGPKLAESTKKIYTLSVDKATRYLGEGDVTRMTERTMLTLRKQLIDDDGESNAAIWIRHLAAILNMAKRKKLIRENPITLDVKFQAPDQPVTCYTEMQLGNLLQTADALGWAGLSDQIQFLVFSGFRSMESCVVEWSQIDKKRETIRYWNQKGKRWEDQPMDKQFAGFIARLPHKYDPYIFRYRHKAGLNHAVKKINRLLEHADSLNVHTLKTCAVGRWKAMGLEVLTISKLAHHRNIDTTRRHYDYFDTEKIVGRMNLGPEAAGFKGEVEAKEKITTISLQSET